jgi:hypothetical protein
VTCPGCSAVAGRAERAFPRLAVKDRGLLQPGTARLVEAAADQVEFPELKFPDTIPLDNMSWTPLFRFGPGPNRAFREIRRRDHD